VLSHVWLRAKEVGIILPVDGWAHMAPEALFLITSVRITLTGCRSCAE